MYLIKENHKRWKWAQKDLEKQGGMDFDAVWKEYTKEFDDLNNMKNKSPDVSEEKEMDKEDNVKPTGNQEGLDHSGEEEEMEEAEAEGLDHPGEEKEVDEEETHYKPGQDTKQPFVPTHP